MVVLGEICHRDGGVHVWDGSKCTVRFGSYEIEG